MCVSVCVCVCVFVVIVVGLGAGYQWILSLPEWPAKYLAWNTGTRPLMMLFCGKSHAIPKIVTRVRETGCKRTSAAKNDCGGS